METERPTEFPHIDRRPRKRARLAWDVLPQDPKAQLGMFYGQDVGNITSYAPSEHTSSLFVKGVARNGSPPWRDDDKDGHYTFALGDNLTSRYKIHSKMGEGTFGQVLECWDRERKQMVAIKIVRGIKKYREAAMIEIDVLQQLAKYDRSGKRYLLDRHWMGVILRDYPSQVLLKSSTLVAPLTNIRIIVTLYQHVTIVHLRLFLVLVGVIHVMCGVLAVSWLNYVLEKHCFRLTKTWNTLP